MQQNTGKLVKLDISPFTKEEYAEKILEGKKVKYYDTYLEGLLDKHYETYFEYKNELYKILDCNSEEEDADIFVSKSCKDGTIDFITRYYDGGCGFSEALGYALDNLDKENLSKQ